MKRFAILAILFLLTSGALAQSSLPTVTIASGQTTSTVAELGSKFLLVGIEMPVVFTGTSLTFECSVDGTIFKQIFSNGAAVTLTVAQDRYESTSSIAGSLAGCGRIKLVSGSAEGAERSIRVQFK